VVIGKYIFRYHCGAGKHVFSTWSQHREVYILGVGAAQGNI
jgi:hypothetical protein